MLLAGIKTIQSINHYETCFIMIFLFCEAIRTLKKSSFLFSTHSLGHLYNKLIIRYNSLFLGVPMRKTGVGLLFDKLNFGICLLFVICNLLFYCCTYILRNKTHNLLKYSTGSGVLILGFLFLQ